MSDDVTKDPERPGVPGQWVVIGLFAFGILLTGILWNYTRLHNAPFLPLRGALVAEYTRKAVPRVEGGRHRGGPMILRIVLNVDFKPNSTADGIPGQVRQMTDRITELARQNTDLGKYEFLEIYLVQLVPEGVPERLEIKRKVADVLNAKSS